MDASLLEMSGISKKFGPTVALNNVSFSIQPGQVTALIGENGAGKSTLMRLLSGAILRRQCRRVKSRYQETKVNKLTSFYAEPANIKMSSNQR